MRVGNFEVYPKTARTPDDPCLYCGKRQCNLIVVHIPSGRAGVYHQLCLEKLLNEESDHEQTVPPARS